MGTARLLARKATGRMYRATRHIESQPGACAMFFHCQTRLIETFRELYPDTFVFEGNRAMSVSPSKPLPEEEIRHCVSLALTYHQWK